MKKVCYECIEYNRLVGREIPCETCLLLTEPAKEALMESLKSIIFKKVK